MSSLPEELGVLKHQLAQEEAKQQAKDLKPLVAEERTGRVMVWFADDTGSEKIEVWANKHGLEYVKVFEHSISLMFETPAQQKAVLGVLARSEMLARGLEGLESEHRDAVHALRLKPTSAHRIGDTVAVGFPLVKKKWIPVWAEENKVTVRDIPRNGDTGRVIVEFSTDEQQAAVNAMLTRSGITLTEPSKSKSSVTPISAPSTDVEEFTLQDIQAYKNYFNEDPDNLDEDDLAEESSKSTSRVTPISAKNHDGVIDVTFPAGTQAHQLATWADANGIAYTAEHSLDSTTAATLYNATSEQKTANIRALAEANIPAENLQGFSLETMSLMVDQVPQGASAIVHPAAAPAEGKPWPRVLVDALEPLGFLRLPNFGGARVRGGDSSPPVPRSPDQAWHGGE